MSICLSFCLSFIFLTLHSLAMDAPQGSQAEPYGGSKVSKQVHSDNDTSEVDTSGTFWDFSGHFGTFWDNSEDFMLSLEQLDHFYSHFLP